MYSTFASTLRSPKGANHIQSCYCSPPSGTAREGVSSIRRFHSLWSFHPRLFTFAPFGDGKMLLAKVLYFYINVLRCKSTVKMANSKALSIKIG